MRQKTIVDLTHPDDLAMTRSLFERARAYRKELQRYLDHELSPEIQEAVTRHLHGCVDCLQAFDFHAELKLAIRRKCRSDEMPSF